MTVASPSQPVAATPLLKIRPSSRWKPINFREIWMFRDLIRTLAGRDVKLRYRQTALGVIWVILQPLMGAAIFSFLSLIAGTPTDGPRFPFIFVSFLAWTAFSQTLTKSGTVLIQNTQLVSKVYFPRLVLPLSTVLSVLIDFIVGLVMLAIVLAIWRVPPTAAMLLLPVWLLLLLMLAMGLGLIAAGLTVQYRDVQYILPVMIQFLLFASPIWYSKSLMPAKYLLAYQLNPLSGLLDGFRWSVLREGQLDPLGIAYSVAFAVGAMVVGAFMFRGMERRFADVI